MRRHEAWVRRLVLLGMALLNSGCHRSAPRDDDTGEATNLPKRVRCVPAQLRQVADTLDLHGTVAPLPDRDAQIAPQVAGRILQVLVREGDRVTRNQALARIDDAGLHDQAMQVAAQLAKAHAETTLAMTSRARIQRVFEHGIAARQELDDAVARQATAEANEAEAKASSQITNRQLDRATVRSPLAGIVLKVFRKTGELVDGTGATPIVEVGDPSALELVATATAAELVSSKVGALATIDVPSVPEMSLLGAVAAVSPAVDRGSGLGIVRVSLKLSGDAAPPVGVSGTAHVMAGKGRAAAVVPAQALRAAIGPNAEVVVCGADKRAHVVRVARGITKDAWVEISSTTTAADGGALAVKAGVQVAVEPVLGIGDGDPLELVHD